MLSPETPGPRWHMAARLSLAAGVLIVGGAEQQATPACPDVDTVGPIGEFALSESTEIPQTTAPKTEIPQVYRVGEFVRENGSLTPAELVQAYASEITQETGRELSVTLDEDVIPKDWDNTPGSPEVDEQKSLANQQERLLTGVDNLLHVFNEYDETMLADLEVHSARVGAEYERFRGHFSPSKEEVFIEFGAFSHEDSLSELRAVVSHEVLGHAAHFRYCGEVFKHDAEISMLNGNFSYIGHVDDDAPQEEVWEHYDQVPANLLAYGPERVFARAYGATNVKEDVATIVEFITERRGLIQEGDADYGSILHRKQQIIVDRLDALLPGFADFATQRTAVLRSNPANESWSNRSRDIIIPPSVVPAENDYDADATTPAFLDLQEELNTTTVLNGALYIHDTDRRTGTLHMNPIVRIDPDGAILSFHYGTRGKSWGSRWREEGVTTYFFKADQAATDVITINYDELQQTATSLKADSKEANNFFAQNPTRIAIN